MKDTHAQPGILNPVPKLARYLTLTLTDATKLRTALQSLHTVVDGNHCVVGLGAALIGSLSASVPGLKSFPALTGAGIEIPSTPGSVWCWLRGDDRGELVLRARKFTTLLAPAFELLQTVDAFKYDTGRDLTGYEDGTENPGGDKAIETAIVLGSKPSLSGSSFVAVQQWRHYMDRFELLPANEQDNAVGRRKRDNEELADAPDSAHVKRTAQESFSPQAFVLRRSMPWASESQLGLMFVAFGHSFDAFEAQLRRMAGLEDGIVDALFKFTRPITGNYYWCPPLKDGRLNLSAIGL